MIPSPSQLVREGGHMTERTNGHGMYPWGRLVLFVLFLIFLAIVLKAMGWCVGGWSRRFAEVACLGRINEKN